MDFSAMYLALGSTDLVLDAHFPNSLDQEPQKFVVDKQ